RLVRRAHPRAPPCAGRPAGVAGRPPIRPRPRGARGRLSRRARHRCLGQHGRPLPRLAMRAGVRATPRRRGACNPLRPLATARGRGSAAGGRRVSTPTVAERLGDEGPALRAGSLPPQVLERANALLLDFLGVTLAGVPEESSRTLRRGLERLGLRGDGTVLGTTERLPPPQAALVNGAAAHAIEMDDTHLGGSIHLGSSI